MRRDRRTKIIATLGPATDTEEMISDLFQAGADLFRINMSHSSHEELLRYTTLIRNVEQRLNRPIGIIADLQGPKLRIGDFEKNSVILKEKSCFSIDKSIKAGDHTRVYTSHHDIFSAVQPGHRILLDDGKICLRIEAVSSNSIETSVIIGGKIANRRGLSFPDTILPRLSFPTKDQQDLQAALMANVDWIALSFVQSERDILKVRKLAKKPISIIAKIEKPQAVQNLESILDAADAVMIARGDLGIEMRFSSIPSVQKRIIFAAREIGKPVIVATQMLETMISKPIPTRAEVSDVATAVFEGADAIMLSAESATGAYPIKSVQIMNQIAEEIERDIVDGIVDYRKSAAEPTGSDAIAAAARTIAETLEMTAIVCWTTSGFTAARVARERPKPLIITLTPFPEVARKLVIVWGLHCIVTEEAKDLDDVVERACCLAHSNGFSKNGDKIVIVAGVPLGNPGMTNMLRIAALEL